MTKRKTFFVVLCELMVIKKRKHAPAKRIAALLSGVGLSLLITSAMGFWGGKQAENWGKSEGIVQKSTIQGSASGLMGSSPTYTPLITYRYQYQGKNYIGERIYFLNIPGWTFQHAAGLQKRFPEKAVIEVFVDPDNPEYSVLLTGVPPNISIILGVGIFFAVIGVLSGYSAYKKSNNNGRKEGE